MKDEKRKKMSFCVGRNNQRRKQVSHESGLKWTGLNSISIKWMRSQLTVVSNERVANQQVTHERGLKWSGLSCLHTKPNWYNREVEKAVVARAQATAPLNRFYVATLLPI